MTRSSTASVTSMTSVKVSTNGGTPIAGWFIMEHPIKKNGWFGATHFRKPPNINRYSTDINSIYASPMESRNPGAAWFVADLEVTKKSMRFPGRDSQLCAKQLTSQCGQPRYGPKYLDLSPMTDPWCCHYLTTGLRTHCRNGVIRFQQKGNQTEVCWLIAIQ